MKCERRSQLGILGSAIVEDLEVAVVMVHWAGVVILRGIYQPSSVVTSCSLASLDDSAQPHCALAAVERAGGSCTCHGKFVSQLVTFGDTATPLQIAS